MRETEMRWRVLAEFLGLQCVWLACAFGAAKGSALPGWVAAGTFIALQLTRSRSMAMVQMILTTGAVGAVVESLFAGAGIIHYAAAWPTAYLAPSWIEGLWLGFGSTLATTTRLLAARALVKAAALGAILSPFSYAAGFHLGALVIMEPTWISYSAIAGAWAIVLPGLIALCRSLDGQVPPRLKPVVD